MSDNPFRFTLSKVALDLRRACIPSEREFGDLRRNAILWLSVLAGMDPTRSSFGFSRGQPRLDILRLSEVTYLASLGFLLGTRLVSLDERSRVEVALQNVMRRRPHTPEQSGFADDPLDATGLILLACALGNSQLAQRLRMMIDEQTITTPILALALGAATPDSLPRPIVVQPLKISEVATVAIAGRLSPVLAKQLFPSMEPRNAEDSLTRQLCSSEVSMADDIDTMLTLSALELILGPTPPQPQTEPQRRATLLPPLSSDSAVDVGVVIALKEEFRVFMKLLPSTYKSQRDEQTGEYYYIFDHPVTRHRVAVTFIGEMGVKAAERQTDRLIGRWSPRTVVMLGIAASLHKDIRAGDVLIASQIDDYLDVSKAQPGDTPGGFEFALGGTVYQGDHDFLTQVRNFEFDNERRAIHERWSLTCVEWLAKLVPKEEVRTTLLQSGLVRSIPEILDAHLASGVVVGAAQQFIRWLQKRDRNLKALDMESAGLMDAALKRVEPRRTLVLRGISDYGDERKSELDKLDDGALRRYAMHNATCLLWALLEADVLPGGLLP